uniref:Testis expressed 30 n=1 Tax=Gouania willdenowi TaxID=441366 RepID=A0A8C5NEW9_GOUWI
METLERFVPFGVKKPLDAVLSVPAAVTSPRTAVILTHGAGGDMNFIHLVSLGQYLASQGFICLRFTCKGLNLGYRVKAYRAVWVLNETDVNTDSFPGRSMGCRAAVALDDALVQGVICLSFPLHPPGQTHKHTQRTEDLRMLSERVRVLFVSGTDDNNHKEMKASTDVLWLQGGSHGLTVKGRSESSVLEEVNLKVIKWLHEQKDSTEYVLFIMCLCW